MSDNEIQDLLEEQAKGVREPLETLLDLADERWEMESYRVAELAKEALRALEGRG